MPGEEVVSEALRSRRERRAESRRRQMRRAELIENAIAAFADADLALRDVEAGFAPLGDVLSTLRASRVTINRSARELEYKFRAEDMTSMPSTLVEGRELLDRLVAPEAAATPEDRDRLERIIERFGAEARPYLAPARVAPIMQVNWHQLRRLLPGV
jgi:hypothetical protein